MTLNDIYVDVLARIGGDARSYPVIDAIERCAGHALGPALRAYFAVYEERQLDGLPLLCCWDERDRMMPSPERGNTFAQALREQPSLIGALTHSLPLGTEGGGDVYFASLEPDDPEIAIYSPGTGEMMFLADSPAALAAMVDLCARWERHAEQHGLDTGDLVDGDLEVDLGDPALADIAARVDLIRGHVNLPGPDDAEVGTLFDEIIGALAGGPMPSARSSRLVRDHARAYPIHRMLHHGGLFPLAADPPEPWSDRVPDALYWLWRHYLTASDDALATALARCAVHPAELVRDAAAFVADLAGDGEVPAWSHLRVLRRLASSPEPREAPGPTGDLLAARDGDSEAEAKLKTLLRDAPDNADAWDNLTYHRWQAEDWAGMLACAEISTRLRPEHYYAWMQTGIALHAMRRHRAAIAAYDRGLCFWFHENLYRNKALSYLELGDRAAAIAVLRQLPGHMRRRSIEEVDELAPLADEVG